jgi:hypothetical protein
VAPAAVAVVGGVAVGDVAVPALPTPCCAGPVKDVLLARELATSWEEPVPMTWLVMGAMRFAVTAMPPVGEDVPFPVGDVVSVVSVSVGLPGTFDQRVPMPADRSGSGTRVGVVPLGDEPKL